MQTFTETVLIFTGLGSQVVSPFPVGVLTTVELFSSLSVLNTSLLGAFLFKKLRLGFAEKGQCDAIVVKLQDTIQKTSLHQ